VTSARHAPADGHGSSYLYDWAKGRWPLRTSADPKFWERHLGTDALCTMWFMCAIATGMEAGVAVLVNVWPTSFKMWFLLADGAILLLAMCRREVVKGRRAWRPRSPSGGRPRF
jgi:hypothetical protein